MCDSDDGQPAAFLVTNLDNGDTLSPCLAHAGDVFASLAQAFLGAPDQEPAPGADVNGAGAGEAGAATAPPGRKRRQGGRPAASQALDSAASPFPNPTPVEP
jgi:hypothetical protein